MKEQNRQTLRDALRRLPQHVPPPGLWSDVRRHLEPQLADRLPSYQPPPQVWNRLAAKLGDGAPVPQAEKESRVRKLPYLRWAAIAAGFLLLLTAGIGQLNGRSGPTVRYTYAQEATPPAATRDWNDDEASFTGITAKLEARNEPELNTLRMELDELTEAREEVRAILAAYGEDPQVIGRLAEIERDRSAIYRRIIDRL